MIYQTAVLLSRSRSVFSDPVGCLKHFIGDTNPAFPLARQ